MVTITFGKHLELADDRRIWKRRVGGLSWLRFLVAINDLLKARLMHLYRRKSGFRPCAIVEQFFLVDEDVVSCLV